MENIDKIEKLSEKSGTNSEDALEALEACNWDILDAMIYLERKGKTKAPKNESFNTSFSQVNQIQDDINEEEKEYENHSFGYYMKKLGLFIKSLIQKGNRNFIQITKQEEEIIKVPITLFVILLIFLFWPIVVLFVISLLIGVRYHLIGPDMKADTVNKALDSASKTAEDIKNDVMENFKNR